MMLGSLFRWISMVCWFCAYWNVGCSIILWGLMSAGILDCWMLKVWLRWITLILSLDWYSVGVLEPDVSLDWCFYDWLMFIGCWLDFLVLIWWKSSQSMLVGFLVQLVWSGCWLYFWTESLLSWWWIEFQIDGINSWRVWVNSFSGTGFVGLRYPEGVLECVKFQ